MKITTFIFSGCLEAPTREVFESFLLPRSPKLPLVCFEMFLVCVCLEMTG